MSTLKDVCNVHDSVMTMVGLFGCAEGFTDEFFKRYQAIGRDFCERKGFPFGEDPGLNLEAEELPSETEQLFTELKSWLRTANVVA